MFANWFQIMGLPLFSCLLLAGIHVYLGIHVLARKVIFVDLALAQMAALGAVCGIGLGYTTLDDPWAIKGFSFLFAVAAALVFSLTRERREKIPQEATIGITYAVALSATILASAHLPHGADELRELLSGNILWVDAKTLIYTALLYSVVGVFHYVFRRYFLLISLQPEQALAKGISIKLWDFLFYVSFGLVVTSSVSIAGVLLVFCYLVIPAVAAFLLVQSLFARLLVGWLIGAVVSFVGVMISYFQDLPSGPTIVVSFAVFLVGIVLTLHIWNASSRTRAVLQVSVGVFLVCGLFCGISFLRKVPHVHVDARAPWQVRLANLENKSLPVLHQALFDESDEVREKAVFYVRSLLNPSSKEPLYQAILKEPDDYIRVEMAETLLELKDSRGVSFLIDVMDRGEAEQSRQDAYDHLKVHFSVPFQFSPQLSPQENDVQLEKFRRWWKSHLE